MSNKMPPIGIIGDEKIFFQINFVSSTDRMLGNLGTETGSTPAIHAPLNVRSYPPALSSSAQNIKGETQELDPDQQHERYLKAGQLSVEAPGQLSAEINSPTVDGHGVPLRRHDVAPLHHRQAHHAR
jgi:hypothetical protein